MKADATILWRQLGTEGHDGCRLLRLGDGWRLAGTALFVHEGEPSILTYEADCDAAWRTRSARVSGSIGARPLDLRIATRDGHWILNGVEQPQVDGCIDVDLGFTPATNLLPLRRFALPVGQATPVPASYLPFPDPRLERLEQTYRRLDARRYAYAAPAYGYDDVLTVADCGFVLDYPGLWTATG